MPRCAGVRLVFVSSRVLYDGIAMSRCFCNSKCFFVRSVSCAPLHFLATVLVMCSLCACATPRSEQASADSAAYAALPPTQRPYNVFGVWYYPIPSSLGFAEEGLASWYGPGFHGKKTSNGESYDMHALTAAHKTLPLGTLVKVTRRDTGTSVVVRLNDRGPFVAGRIIDLSYSGAHALDMIGSGTAPVRIEALQRATQEKHDGRSVWTPEPIPDFGLGTFSIVVGMYALSADADVVRTRLVSEGHDVLILRVDTPDGVRYRVCAGKYHDLIEAHISAVYLQETGYAEACVTTLDTQ